MGAWGSGFAGVKGVFWEVGLPPTKPATANIFFVAGWDGSVDVAWVWLEWLCLALIGVAWLGLAFLCGLVCLDLVWLGLAWLGLAWLDLQ